MITAAPDMPIGMAQCAPAGGALHAQYVWNDVLVAMQRSDYGST